MRTLLPTPVQLRVGQGISFRQQSTEQRATARRRREREKPTLHQTLKIQTIYVTSAFLNFCQTFCLFVVDAVINLCVQV